MTGTVTVVTGTVIAEVAVTSPTLRGTGPGDDPVAAADAFAFPSTRVGFALAAMEALAAGVPVGTRDLPVLREVFGDAVRYARDPVGLAAALVDAVTAPADGRLAAGRKPFRLTCPAQAPPPDARSTTAGRPRSTTAGRRRTTTEPRDTTAGRRGATECLGRATIG